MLHLKKKRDAKKKAKNIALIKLRKIIGMTQKEFAVRTGVSLDLIKGVESGRNKLSHSLARRIFMSTGVEVSSLFNGSVNPLRGAMLGDYTKEYFEHWSGRMFPSTEDEAWHNFEGTIAPHMMLMLLAATWKINPKKAEGNLNALIESWSEWAREAVEHFGLKEKINDILKQYPVTSEKTMTWGEWRAKVKEEAKLINDWQEKNPGKILNSPPDFTVRWWKFREDPKKHDSEMLTLKAVSHYQFIGAWTYMGDFFNRLKEAKEQKGKK